MFNDCHDGICYITNIKNGKKFGEFIEKTLICNKSADNVINNICDEYRRSFMRNFAGTFI